MKRSIFAISRESLRMLKAITVLGLILALALVLLLVLGTAIPVSAATTPTTLTVDTATGTYGDTATLTATLTVTAGGAPVEGKIINFTLNGVPAGSDDTDASGIATIPAADLTGIDAGTYGTGVAASFAGDATYDASSGNNSLTVDPLAIEVTADDQSKTYGDADPAFTYQITSGSLVGGDTFTGDLDRDAGEDVGFYAITRNTLAIDDGNGGANYDLTFVDGELEITPLAIKVTSDNTGKTYGDPDPLFTWTITDGALVGGDTIIGTMTRDAGENVAFYAIQQGSLAIDDGNGGANYALTFVEGDLEITPLAIEVTADDQSKTYGDADPALTYQITSGSLVGSDNFTGALSRVAGENIGFYAIQQGSLAIDDGNGGANYSFTFVDGELEITPLAIEVTADDQGKTYGDADPALTYQITSGSLVGSDNFTGALARVAGENVGFYAIQQGSLAIDDSNGGANYALTFVEGELEITPKALTITGITGSNKMYDGTTDAMVDPSAAVLNGVIGSDNVTIDDSLAVANFDNKHVGTGKTITVTGLILAGDDAGNYYLVDPTTTADISQADLTITAQTNTKTYDGDASAAAVPTVSGLMPGDTVTDLSEVYDNHNAGTSKTLYVDSYTVNDGNGGNNYNVILVDDTTGVINQAQLTITGLAGVNKVYDGTTDATVDPSAAVLNGVIGSDNVTIDDSLAIANFADKHVGTGKTITVAGLILTGDDAGNYYLVGPTTTTADISQAQLTITGLAGVNKVYDGTTDATVDPSAAVLNGVIGSDNVTIDDSLAIANFADKHVGTGKTITVTGLVLTGDDAGNYNLVDPTTTADITPLAIEVTSDNTGKTYGDPDPLFTWTITGGALVGSDTIIGTMTRDAGENVGFYNILQGTVVANDGNGGANYDLTFVSSGQLQITPKAITITGITGINKVYDGTTDATVDPSAAVLNGVIGSDNVTIDDSLAVANFADKHVGTSKTITVTGLVLTGDDAGNYYLVDPTTTADITALAIEVTAYDQSKVYGDADPTLTYQVTIGGLVGSDIFTGTLSRVAGENVGFYAIQQGSLAIDDGNGGANYSLTFVNGELEITPLAIEVTADDQSRAFGDADPALTWTVTSGGLVGTDNFTGTLARVAGENVGFYAITDGTLAINDGNGGNNYTLTFVNGELEITPRAITVTADDQSKVYGDADPALTYQITSGSLVGSDTFTGALDRVAGENVGFYAITQDTLAINDGNGGANYALTFVDGELEITPKALTITGITGSNRVYDGTTDATMDPSAAVLNGVIGSDNVTIDDSLAVANFADKHVGTGKTITVTGVVLTGDDAGNYYLVDPTTTADITPLAIEVTSDSAGKTYGDPDPLFTWTITGGALVGGDTFTGAPDRVAGENVGFYAIQQGTLVINDGNGGLDYNLTFVSSGQLEITPRAITVTADDQSKVYGDADPALTVTGGLVGSDTFTGALVRAAGENVGTYAITQGTLAIDDGNGGANYALTFVDGELEITPKSLTVSANDRSKTYGDTITFAGIEFTATGLVGSDNVTSVTLTSAGAAAAAAAGTHDIVPSAAAGTGLGNYTITYVNGTLTVNPAALTITAADASKTYGDTVIFAGTEFTATGLVGSDNVASVTLTSAGAAATAAAGTHDIVPSAAAGTGLENYDITYVGGALTVNPKALTITANNRSKTYGDTVTLAGTEFTATGLVNADTITSVTLTSAGAAAGATAAGSPYSIVPSAAVGTGLSNYTFVYVNGTLTVNKGIISCSITSSLATSKRGKLVTFTATLTGTGATGTVTFQDGGTVLGSSTLSNGTATYSTSNLSVGSHFITAVYSGDANFAGSTSPAITHTVKKAAGVNWGLIIGIILAGLLVSLFFFLIFFTRRRKKDEQQKV